MLPQQQNYPLARRLSLQALERSDLRDRAAKAGGRLVANASGETRIELAYLGRNVVLSFPSGDMEIAGQDSLPLREEILILHYLGRAGGRALSGEWISFADLPSVSFYQPVFRQRCRAPLGKHFGQAPENLIAAAGPWGGKKVPLGDAGVEIPVFPRVPLALVLWRGDEDFPADGNLLFDASVTDYLSTEDIVTVGETVVWKLIKAQK